MIIKVDSKKLVCAVKKVEKTCKESVIVRFKNLPDGTVGAQLITTDGTAQSQIGIITEVDNAVEDDYSIVFPADFIGTVKGICSLGEKIELTLNETSCLIVCGSAKITLPLLKEGQEISVSSPQKEKFVAFMTTREEIKKALAKGALASDNGTGQLDNTLFLNFSKLEEEYKLLMITLGGSNAIISAKYAAIQVPTECEEMMKSMVEEDKTIFVATNHFLGTIENLSEKIAVYVFDKQTVICSGPDTYVFINKAIDFKVKMLKEQLLFKKDYTFNIKVDNAELKKALSIATLNVVDDKNKVIVEFKNKELKISSLNGSSIMTVPVKEESEGEIRFGINASFLKRAIERCESDVEIFGTGEKKPVYVRDNDVESDIVITPVVLED